MIDKARELADMRHMNLLSHAHPDGYEDAPASRPVNLGAALIWIRRNPPPGAWRALP